MKEHTINFTGQVYVPKDKKENLGIFNTEEEFIHLALIKGFIVENVSVDRLVFSKELDNRLLYKLRFDLRTRDETKATITDVDELLALLDCYCELLGTKVPSFWEQHRTESISIYTPKCISG